MGGAVGKAEALTVRLGCSQNILCCAKIADDWSKSAIWSGSLKNGQHEGGGALFEDKS